MSGINLTTGDNREIVNTEKLNLGLLALFIVFILSLVLYGTFLFLNSRMSDEIKTTRDQFDAMYADLKDEKARQVVDFQNRLDLSKRSLEESRALKADLEVIESLIVPGSYLESFKYDQATKTIALGCLADNYNTTAKQILSFKKSSAFTSVSAGTTSVKSTSEGGKEMIAFEVVLTLK